MSLSIAIQMDKVESLQIAGDTTFALGLEAQKRGHNLWYYTPNLLSLNEGIVCARGQELTFYDQAGAHFETGVTKVEALQNFDIILMRQDPPFDMAYITSLHLLELLGKKVRVVNDPIGIRNAPEKILMLKFPKIIPANFHQFSDFRTKISANSSKFVFSKQPRTPKSEPMAR